LSGNLPAANKLAKSYFQQVATTVNKNQDHLAAAVKSQLEEYAKLAGILESRRNELDSRLAKMLQQFRAFDLEVKNTVELLTAEIEKAEKLAVEIDPAIPKFADFGASP
jgi:transcription termination factor NusB